MATSCQNSELTILDPRGSVLPAPGGPGAGADIRWRESLEGCRLGFLSNGKPNVKAFMDAVVQRLLRKGAVPGCMLTKAGPLEPAPDALIDTLVQQADLALTGVSDGGTASSWGAHDALRLTAQGVPTVLICTRAFRSLVLSVLPADTPGIVLLEIPHPFSSITQAEVEQAADAAAASLDDLLRKAAEAGRGGDSASCPGADRPADAPRTLAIRIDERRPASDVLYSLHLTDGLPVGIPTVERVEAALAAWQPGQSGEPRPALPPRRAVATAQALATNAILAGLPDHLLPYLDAAVAAACSPAFNLFGVQTTTNPVTPAIVVGGPASGAAGFHHGLGALGPGNIANATLGRALRLCMQNLGGARASDGTDPATMGQPGKYTLCFAASEDDWPWPALRQQTVGAQHGSGDDTVTLVAVTGSINLIIKSQTATELLDTIASSIRITGSNDYMFGGHPLLALCPEHAAILRDEGLRLSDIQAHLFEHSTIPFAVFPRKNQEMMLAPRAMEFDRLDGDTPIPIVARPSDILVCVAGGPSMHSTFFPSFGGSLPTTARVTWRPPPGTDDASNPPR